jgi:TPR repeat protein
LKNSSKNRFWILMTAMVLCVFVVVLCVYLIWIKAHKSTSLKPVPSEKKEAKSSMPRMANLLEKKPMIELPTPPTYPPDAPVLEQARSSLKEGISSDEAVSLAKSLPKSPERADAAFLLFEYAAETGNGEAAKYVARYYDPTDDFPSGTIRKNPEIAYDWYQKALAGGHEDVQLNMAKLRTWVEEQASQGSNEARQLLKDWR